MNINLINHNKFYISKLILYYMKTIDEDVEDKLKKN